MAGKTECSYAYLDFMNEENYHEALGCAQAMLEVFGDAVRHHEMMLTINLRRENVAAALENCNEIIRYHVLEGLDIAEYERHRQTLLTRLKCTRTMMAGQFWEDVFHDVGSAPSRFVGVPLIVAGDAYLERNKNTGGLYFLFYVHGDQEKRVACRLAACEAPFVAGLASPQRLTVHGRFLSAARSVVLLYPCYYLSTFEIPWQ